MEFVKYLTGKDYKQRISDFIRIEKRRSEVTTKAKIQPFCIANNISIGFFNGK